MKRINILIILSILATVFLSSCQSIKDGLSGTKSENSDEFLVQKKNPLVVPPEFMNLPKPKDSDQTSENLIIEEETDIKKILEINNDTETSSEKKIGKAEEFILKNIK